MSQNQRIYDLSKLDFEGNRRRQRHRLLRYSLPICVFALLLAIKLLGMNLINALVNNLVTQKNHSAATSAQLTQRIVNVFEPHLAHYNLGNTLYSQKKWPEAIETYRQALNDVPPSDECRLRVNLTLTLVELAGHQAKQNQFDEAILTYDEAKSTIYGGSSTCGVLFGGKTETAAAKEKSDVDELEKYIKQESSKLKSQRNQDAYQPGQEGEAGDLKEITAEQLEKLQDSASANAKARKYSQSTGGSMIWETPKEPYW